jgi:arylsulfatase A
MKIALMLLLLILMLNAGAQKAAGTKPNIIFIMADDVGYSTLRVNGGQSYSTPRLDSMARHGMNFKHCEATPLCSTSRCMFLTGKYNFRNFSNFNYMNTTDKTVANLLHDAGYVTGIFGKHQLQYGVDTMKNWGWDYHCIFELTENGMKYSRYKNPVLMENGVVHSGSEMQNKYGDDVLTDKIFNFIQTNINKPFFVYYSMSIGHPPICPTPDDSAFAAWNPDRGISDTSFYPSMMHYMDKKVGAILDKLKQMGIAENTLVLFAGDNGTPTEIYYNADGETHIRGEKAWSLEGGTHVPLLAYWPTHITEGSVNNDLVDFSDFFTTFAQTAGVTNLTKYGILDGQSFYDAMLGKPHTPRQQLFRLYNAHPGFLSDRRWVQNPVYKLYDKSDVYKSKNFYNVVNDREEKSPILTKNLTPAEKQTKQNFQNMLDTIGTWPNSPVLNNAAVTNVTSTSAVFSGTVVAIGSIPPLVARGVNVSSPGQQDPYLGVGTLRDPDPVPVLGPVSILRTDLTPQTKYLYSLFAINSNQSHNTGYIVDSFYTLSMPPLTQPTSFTGKPGPTSINLTWAKAKFPPTGARNAGYLLVYSTDSIKIADTPNGKAPANVVIKGTIVPLVSKRLPILPAATTKVNGLIPGMKYNFLLIPYTWCGPVATTYNYLTENARKLTVTTTATGSFALQTQPEELLAQASAGFIISPNPATSAATLFVKGGSAAINVMITDLDRRVLWKKENVREDAINLPVKNLANGLYLVVIKNDENTHVLKLIKSN